MAMQSRSTAYLEQPCICSFSGIGISRSGQVGFVPDCLSSMLVAGLRVGRGRLWRIRQRHGLG